MKRKRAMVLRGEQISPIDGKVAALWRAFGHEFSQLSKDIVYYGMTVKQYPDGLKYSDIENVMVEEIQTATSFDKGYPCSQLTIVFSYTLKGGEDGSENY